MSNQKLISDDDLGKLKIEVLECVKELHKAGGPAAGRFQAKLKFLINHVEICRQNDSILNKDIGDIIEQVNVSNSKLDEIKIRRDNSKCDIDYNKDEIERIEELSQQLESVTLTRNQQVRYIFFTCTCDAIKPPRLKQDV